MTANKYGAIAVAEDGYRFDSKAERDRYRELRLMQHAGHIRDLRVHERFPLRVNGQTVCTYVADFTYHDDRGVFVVEDVKGARTQAYVIKRKLMRAVWGIAITEIDA